ncbi:prepilin peptidase [Campylobacter volucris]|uniref:Prepilin peptidase n=1 Tax=Campylobacter volucris TaxID=1031542 RepID=A0AAE5YHN9_9BACT|nr:A24 family peptidase [Campylobacter volucris]AJC94255.1 peptidase A24 N-terminal domain protein, putative prepilin signal peptidase [Campylobacter volucris LMG 24379]KAB0580410.1 prepilin peptidase [Campylobacter volucris]MBF7043118.1 prepilin peptidase [Campylobacter volucris]MBF7068045.1 prepilin peptidase [Campylobacter volucris]QBL13378.1 prepilin peptidase [Campylobacter volucris]
MIFFILLGLCIGSFINVVIFRSITKQSIIKPRSHCNKCGKTLKIYHLIPILSFVFLKGKCAFCKERISFVYPFNELCCAILFAFCFYFFDFLQALLFALILSVFLMLSWMDYYLKAVSEIWLWILFVFAFLFDFYSYKDISVLNLEEHFLFKICFGAGFFFLLKSFINFIKNFKKRDEILESLGEGDVIIIALIFGIFGYEKAFWILFIASVLSLILFVKIAKKDYQMPMIPFLFIAILVHFGVERVI